MESFYCVRKACRQKSESSITEVRANPRNSKTQIIFGNCAKCGGVVSKIIKAPK